MNTIIHKSINYLLLASLAAFALKTLTATIVAENTRYAR